MMTNNYILEYYQQIQDGTVTVGNWVRLLYERIIRDLEEKRYFFDQKKANRAVLFIETFCHHSKGKLAPGLVKLELWQKALISCVFGLVDDDGLRHYREVLTVIGRKCGKSLLASGIAEKMVFADGEHGADCYMIAPKLDQADIVYSDFVQSVEAEPELTAMMKKRRSDIYITGTNSTVKKLPFSQKKADGLNPHLTVCDEIAAWPGDAGLKQYEVIASALGARSQPLIFSITTANYINDGIYDELMKRSTAFLLGSSNETRLLPFLYMIDDPAKWNDINELRKSLPNLGVSVSVDFILEEIAKAEGSLSKRAEFLTKYANIKQNSSQAWLDYKTVEQCMDDGHDLEEFRGCYAVGGIDLSQAVDLTSACVVITKGGRHYVFSHFWMPENRLETATADDGVPYAQYVQRGILSLSGQNHVEYHDVFEWFRTLIEQYEIYPLQVGYDRYSSTYLVSEMTAYGFHMDDVFQGGNLTPVIRQCEGEMKDGAFCFGDNSLLQMHFLNVALKQEADAHRVRMVKVGTRTRIDGAAAVIDALTVRMKWASEIGEQLKNEG